MESVPAIDPQQLVALKKCIDKSQFAKAVELCNKILSTVPHDARILKTKVISLIQLDHFSEAVSIINNAPDLIFEHAYCLYRLNKIQEALDLCLTIPEPKPAGVLNLEGQARYKLKQYADAAKCYETLMDQEDVDVEVLSNAYAAHVAAGQSQQVLQQHPVQAQDATFEMHFNKACAEIAVEAYDEAKNSLLLAETMCREVLAEEGVSAQDIEKEVTPITLQLAFVNLLLGQGSHSIEVCKRVLQSKNKDQEALAVAANNLAVLRGNSELPDSYRKLRNTITKTAEEKLTTQQLMTIRYNRCLLLLYLKKPDECSKLLDELDATYGSSITSVTIRASILAQQQKWSEFSALLKLQPTSDRTQLLLAQAHIAQQEYSAAFNILSRISSLSMTPAGISACYHCLSLAKENTSEYLKNLLKTSAPTSTLAVSALLHVADLFVSLRDYESASSALKLVLQSSSIDSTTRITVTAKLISTLSHVSPEEADRYTSNIPQVDFEVLDGAELESRAIPRTSKRKDALLSSTKSTPKESTLANRKARAQRRKARQREEYLKSLQEKGKYDPNRPVKPDPERWLPRNQRSYNKRGRKNRNKFVGGQGSGDGAQKDMLKLDVAARVAAAKQAEEAAAPKVSVSKKSGKKKR